MNTDRNGSYQEKGSIDDSEIVGMGDWDMVPKTIVLFQMSDGFRQAQIDRQIFYVDQARKRLLSQFSDLEKEADQASEEWLEQNSHRFSSETDDPVAFQEEAYFHGAERYQLLARMLVTTRLNVVAGMYHEWEKQHKTWILDEARHWHDGAELVAAVWKADFRQLLELWNHLGWDISTENFVGVLDACRLVVNVHKHGGGTSLGDLKQRFPEYMVDPLRNAGGSNHWQTEIDHTHLKLAERHLEAFSDAIIAFWQRIPSEVWNHQVTTVPDWFGKALEKDQKANLIDRL